MFVYIILTLGIGQALAVVLLFAACAAAARDASHPVVVRIDEHKAVSRRRHSM